MSEPCKRGRPKKKLPELTERQVTNLLEATYFAIHGVMFLTDKNSPQVMQWLTSGNPLEAHAAVDYLNRRQEAIDYLLAHAKPKERDQ